MLYGNIKQTVSQISNNKYYYSSKTRIAGTGIYIVHYWGSTTAIPSLCGSIVTESLNSTAQSARYTFSSGHVSSLPSGDFYI